MKKLSNLKLIFCFLGRKVLFITNGVCAQDKVINVAVLHLYQNSCRRRPAALSDHLPAESIDKFAKTLGRGV